MAYNFEVFSRTSVPLSKDPAVTIQHRGSLSLNKSAYVLLGSPTAVQLMYDRSSRVIGIRATADGAADAYVPRAATKDGDAGPFLVAGKAFLSHFRIEMKQTKRYLVTVEDGILLVDLKQPGTTITGSRNGHVRKE